MNRGRNGDPLRVLLVEDAPDDAELNLRELRRGGFQVEAQRVETSASMIDALVKQPWDLVLSDFQLPTFGGLEALRVLQASEQDLPFIIVSGAIGEEIAVSAMKAGAHDYVPKGNLARLCPVVERELREAWSRSEKREAEAALRASEARYRDLFEHLPIPTWVADYSGVKALLDNYRQEGVHHFRPYFTAHPEELRRCASAVRTIDISQSNVAFFGVKQKEDLPGQFSALFEEASWPVFQRELLALVEGRTAFHGEMPIGDLHGGRKIISLHVSVSPGFEESLERVLITFMDVTERVRMESLLLDSRANLEQAQRIASLGSWEWDFSRSTHEWSPQMFEIFGLPAVSGVPTYDQIVALVHPEDRANVLCAMESVIATGEFRSLEYRILRSGAIRHVHERVERFAHDREHPLHLRGTVQDITDQWEMQEQLRRSEAQMSAVLENTEDLILSRDLDDRCLYFNQAFARAGRDFLGIDIKPGMRTLDHFPEEDREHWASVLASVRAGKSHREEVRLELGTKGTRYYEVTINPIWHAENLVGSIQIHHDITERKRMEMALRDSETRLRHAAAATGFGVYELNFQTGHRYHAPEFETLYGLEPGQPLELDEEGIPKIIHPEDRSLYLTRKLSSSDPNGNGIFEAEYRILRPDGQWRWLRMLGKTQFLDAKPWRAHGIVQDITQQKHAEADLQKAKAELERFFNLIPDPACVASAGGYFIRLNPVWHALLGYPETELLSQPYLEWVHPEDRASTRQEMLGEQAGFGTTNFTNRYRCSDGSYRWLEWNASPPADGHIFAIARDITERKRMEASLQEMEKMSAKGQMAAYIAHEINNPLAGIKNAFALVEKAIPPEHVHARYSDLIKREIDRIAGIIRTMYHVYRPPTLEVKAISLQQAFSDIDGLVEAKCRAGKVDISIAMEDPDLAVVMNEGLLRQVLFNLVLNAIDATPEGGAVTLGAFTEQEHHVIMVEDEGPGIPEELAESVFQPGFTTKRDSAMSGLGLGLSACRNIIESLGGTLIFKPSARSRGTRFEARIPRMDTCHQPAKVNHDLSGR